MLNQKKLISKDEFNQKSKNLNIKIQAFRKEKDKLFNELEIKKNDQIKFFFSKIDPYLKEFMKENSIDVLLDKKNVIVGIESLDITNKLKELIDKNLN